MSGSIYQRVPKPPVLRRDHPHVGDMPVPWVTCYGEGPSLVEPTVAGLTVGCDCQLGEGTPSLGKQCPVRQRRAMTQRRCSTCGTRIKGMALFAGVVPTELPGEPTRVPVTAEAPTHPLCLAYSALTCPKLAGDPERCLVLPVAAAYPLMDQWRLLEAGELTVSLFQPHGTPRPPSLPFALDYVYGRLDLPGQRATFLSDWMRRTAPQPYRRLWAEIRKELA